MKLKRVGVIKSFLLGIICGAFIGIILGLIFAFFVLFASQIPTQIPGNNIDFSPIMFLTYPLIFGLIGVIIGTFFGFVLISLLNLTLRIIKGLNLDLTSEIIS